MTLITLICTVALCIGLDGSVHFVYPYDLKMSYRNEKVERQNAVREIEKLEDKYHLTASRVDIYDEVTLHVKQNENRFFLTLFTAAHQFNRSRLANLP